MARRSTALKPTEAQLEVIRNLFRQWGRMGGEARAANLTPQERSEIARRAGKASKRARQAPRKAIDPVKTATSARRKK
jgi:hypothetical protein